MDDDKQREIASQGGKQSGGNFKNDPQRAAEAGREGGQQTGGDRESSQQSGGNRESEQRTAEEGRGDRHQGGNFADDPERAREAGRKGGQS
ncbi:general stress protein [Phyllobacterium sp. 1468]|uniref:general stress protein n=1 Tax=Phyllobacterium sp. 1468 TaxID=2817759 RepID=UPI0038620D10